MAAAVHADVHADGHGDMARLADTTDVALWLCQNTATRHGVAVFSAMPEVATTPSALALARLLAVDAKVVVVSLAQGPDADAGAAPPDPGGLSDVIDGTASFGRIISRDRLSRVHLVNRGAADLARSAIVEAPRFKVMMEALDRAYDYVIIDGGHAGPDCLGLADMAPRCVVVGPVAAQPETMALLRMLTGAGFADITVMAPAEAAAASGRAAA